MTTLGLIFYMSKLTLTRRSLHLRATDRFHWWWYEMLLTATIWRLEAFRNGFRRGHQAISAQCRWLNERCAEFHLAIRGSFLLTHLIFNDDRLVFFMRWYLFAGRATLWFCLRYAWLGRWFIARFTSALIETFSRWCTITCFLMVQVSCHRFILLYFWYQLYVWYTR